MKEEEYRELSNRAYKIVENPDVLQDIKREIQAVFGNMEEVLENVARDVVRLDGITLPYREYWESNISIAMQQIENEYKRKNEDKAHEIRSMIQHMEQKKEEEEVEIGKLTEEEEQQKRMQEARREDEVLEEYMVRYSKNREYVETIKGMVEYAISDSKSKLMRSLGYTSIPERKREDIEYEISYVKSQAQLKLDKLEELLEVESNAKARVVTNLYDEYRMMAQQREKNEKQSARNSFVAGLSLGVVVDEEQAKKEAQRKVEEKSISQALPDNIIE